MSGSWPGDAERAVIHLLHVAELLRKTFTAPHYVANKFLKPLSRAGLAQSGLLISQITLKDGLTA